MSAWSLKFDQWQLALLALNVLLIVTWITLFGWLVASLLKRRPAMRHGLLITALALILLSPVIGVWQQAAGRGLLRISIDNQTSLVATSQPAPQQQVDVSIAETGFRPPEQIDSDDSRRESLEPMGLSFESAEFDVSDLSMEIPVSDQSNPSLARLTAAIIHVETTPADRVQPTAKLNNLGRTMSLVGTPLVIVWLFGAMILLLRQVCGLFRLRAILHSGESNCDSGLQMQFATVCRSLGYSRPTKLLWSDQISGPISVGLLEPCVVLPKALAGQLTHEEWRAVLIHEVSHLRRADAVIVLMQNLIGSLFWIHPLVHRLNRQVAQAREEICDNHVLSEIASSFYSETLLKLASTVRPITPLPGATGLFASQWKLERRIAGLLDEHRDLTTRLSWRSALFACLLPILVGAVATFGTVSFAVEPTPAPDNDQPTAVSRPANSPAVPDDNINQGWPAPVDDGLLSLNLIVRMPDGSSAGETRVTSYSHLRAEIQKSSTNSKGRVTIRDVFGHGANIHASSLDGRLQATLKISALDTRSKLSAPITLTLQPVVERQVHVTADGKPALGTSIIIYGSCFESAGITGADGVATLTLPAKEGVRGVLAWHRDGGIAGTATPRTHPLDPVTSLALDPVEPTSIRVLDDHGNVVPNLDLCVTSLYFLDAAGDDRRHLITSSLPEATIRTNAEGQSSLNATPRGRSPYLHFESLDNGWKIDRVDQMSASNRSTTAHVRRVKPAIGRVFMPSGVSAQGLLISGNGFGGHGNNYGDEFLSRVRQDGTFQYRVPTSHGYCVALSDHEWFSAPWTGLILKSFDTEPAEITLQAQRSTSIKVRVTQGADRKPYPEAMVSLGRDKSFRFTTESGEKINAMGSMMQVLEVNANGEARGGTPLGNIRVSAGVGMWHESKQIKVTANQPVEVEFHCAAPVIVQKRELIARMMRDGSAYQPSQSLKVYAWTDFPPTQLERGASTLTMQRASTVHRPNLRADGTIAVTITEDDAKVLAIDEEAKLAGFVKIQKDQSAGTMEMRPCATLQGTVLKEDGEALGERELRGMIGGTAFVPIGSNVRTDAEGKFSFSAIPGELPILLSLAGEETQEQDYRLRGTFVFEIGEARADAKVQAHRVVNEATPKARKPAKAPPLTQRILSPLRDARVSGMHVLALLQGDDSEQTSKLTERILADDDEEENDDIPDDQRPIPKIPAVVYYLPMVVTKSSVNADVDFLKKQLWPQPHKNEIVLIALDAHQTVLGTQRLSASDVEKSTKLANEFMDRHKPTYEDAQAKLDAARTLAAKTNRRIWITACGPRCAPCFQFAQWLESQRELLEKDYVLVKLMGGLQDNADKINDEIGGRLHGIPWFVITEPGGKILISSEGPTGNMGMPSTVEDIRHLRKMLEQTARHLTADQIDALTKSLEPK